MAADQQRAAAPSSASGDPITSTIEVANGITISGNSALNEANSMTATATAAPSAPATIDDDLAALDQACRSDSCNWDAPAEPSVQKEAGGNLAAAAREER